MPTFSTWFEIVFIWFACAYIVLAIICAIEVGVAENKAASNTSRIEFIDAPKQVRAQIQIPPSDFSSVELRWRLVHGWCFRPVRHASASVAPSVSDNREEIRRQRAKGHGIHKIARTLGVGVSVVQRVHAA